MNPYHFIRRDIHENRGPRIGASDISALIPDPERPNQSLAGYDRTAVTVWEEKTGRRQRDPAGLPAQMGHYLEPRVVSLFLRDVFGNDYARQWLSRRLQFEARKMTGDEPNAGQFQVDPVLHNIEWFDDRFVVHPDGLYLPEKRVDAGRLLENGELLEVVAHDLQINLTKPFLIEAKSARFFSARRPEDSVSRGYDLELRTWQGIPLRNYVQIQFQLAMLDVETCYLPLLYDTSQFAVWQITADRSIQGKIIDVAGRLAWHIEHDKPPKEMVINARDIKALYPSTTADFVYVSGDELDAVKEARRQYRKADKQAKVWNAKKKEAQDAVSVHLRDRGELRDPEGKVVAKWKDGYSYESAQSFKDIAKDKNAVRYLRRKGLTKTVEVDRTPIFVGKDEE